MEGELLSITEESLGKRQGYVLALNDLLSVFEQETVTND